MHIFLFLFSLIFILSYCFLFGKKFNWKVFRFFAIGFMVQLFGLVIAINDWDIIEKGLIFSNTAINILILISYIILIIGLIKGFKN
jgi:hypothetical protein